MKYTIVKNEIRKLCCIVVMLAIAAGIAVISVYAASNGIYLATATPHYAHPVTGEVEDSGDSGALGQSMTESVTGRTALVEVDPEGNTFVTVRLQLMDNIENPRFMVDGSSVSATLMQEDYGNNSADYRMRVNDENSIICCKMNVIAMGRDVTFYITVSNLRSGSGDFITSVEIRETEPETDSTPEQKEESVSTEKPKENSVKNEEDASKSETSNAETDSKENKEATDSVSKEEKDTTAEKTVEEEDADKVEQESEEKNAEEEDADKVEQESEEKNASGISAESVNEPLNEEQQPEGKGIAGIIAFLIVAATGGVILYKKKK